MIMARLTSILLSLLLFSVVFSEVVCQDSSKTPSQIIITSNLNQQKMEATVFYEDADGMKQPIIYDRVWIWVYHQSESGLLTDAIYGMITDSSGKVSITTSTYLKDPVNFRFIYCPVTYTGDGQSSINSATELKEDKTCFELYKPSVFEVPADSDLISTPLSSISGSNPPANYKSPPYPFLGTYEEMMYTPPKQAYSFAFCFPLVIIFALLSGALYLSGRNPLSGFDFTAPRMGKHVKYSPSGRGTSVDVGGIGAAFGSMGSEIYQSKANAVAKGDKKVETKKTETKKVDVSKKGVLAALDSPFGKGTVKRVAASGKGKSKTKYGPTDKTGPFDKASEVKLNEQKGSSQQFGSASSALASKGLAGDRGSAGSGLFDRLPIIGLFTQGGKIIDNFEKGGFFENREMGNRLKEGSALYYIGAQTLGALLFKSNLSIFFAVSNFTLGLNGRDLFTELKLLLGSLGGYYKDDRLSAEKLFNDYILTPEDKEKGRGGKKAGDYYISFEIGQDGKPKVYLRTEGGAWKEATGKEGKAVEAAYFVQLNDFLAAFRTIRDFGTSQDRLMTMAEILGKHGVSDEQIKKWKKEAEKELEKGGLTNAEKKELRAKIKIYDTALNSDSVQARVEAKSAILEAFVKRESNTQADLFVGAFFQGHAEQLKQIRELLATGDAKDAEKAKIIASEISKDLAKDIALGLDPKSAQELLKRMDEVQDKEQFIFGYLLDHMKSQSVSDPVAKHATEKYEKVLEQMSDSNSREGAILKFAGMVELQPGTKYNRSSEERLALADAMVGFDRIKTLDETVMLARNNAYALQAALASLETSTEKRDERLEEVKEKLEHYEEKRKELREKGKELSGYDLETESALKKEKNDLESQRFASMKNLSLASFDALFDLGMLTGTDRARHDPEYKKQTERMLLANFEQLKVNQDQTDKANAALEDARQVLKGMENAPENLKEGQKERIKELEQRVMELDTKKSELAKQQAVLYGELGGKENYQRGADQLNAISLGKRVEATASSTGLALYGIQVALNPNTTAEVRQFDPPKYFESKDETERNAKYFDYLKGMGILSGFDEQAFRTGSLIYETGIQLKERGINEDRVTAFYVTVEEEGLGKLKGSTSGILQLIAGDETLGRKQKREVSEETIAVAFALWEESNLKGGADAEAFFTRTIIPAKGDIEEQVLPSGFDRLEQDLQNGYSLEDAEARFRAHVGGQLKKQEDRDQTQEKGMTKVSSEILKVVATQLSGELVGFTGDQAKSYNDQLELFKAGKLNAQQFASFVADNLPDSFADRLVQKASEAQREYTRSAPDRTEAELSKEVTMAYLTRQVPSDEKQRVELQSYDTDTLVKALRQVGGLSDLADKLQRGELTKEECAKAIAFSPNIDDGQVKTLSEKAKELSDNEMQKRDLVEVPKENLIDFAGKPEIREMYAKETEAAKKEYETAVAASTGPFRTPEEETKRAEELNLQEKKDKYDKCKAAQEQYDLAVDALKNGRISKEAFAEFVAEKAPNEVADQLVKSAYSGSGQQPPSKTLVDDERQRAQFESYDPALLAKTIREMAATVQDPEQKKQLSGLAEQLERKDITVQECAKELAYKVNDETAIKLNDSLQANSLGENNSKMILAATELLGKENIPQENLAAYEKAVEELKTGKITSQQFSQFVAEKMPDTYADQLLDLTKSLDKNQKRIETFEKISEDYLKATDTLEQKNLELAGADRDPMLRDSLQRKYVKEADANDLAESLKSKPFSEVVEEAKQECALAVAEYTKAAQEYDKAKSDYAKGEITEQEFKEKRKEFEQKTENFKVVIYKNLSAEDSKELLSVDSTVNAPDGTSKTKDGTLGRDLMPKDPIQLATDFDEKSQERIKELETLEKEYSKTVDVFNKELNEYNKEFKEYQQAVVDFEAGKIDQKQFDRAAKELNKEELDLKRATDSLATFTATKLPDNYMDTLIKESYGGFGPAPKPDQYLSKELQEARVEFTRFIAETNPDLFTETNEYREKALRLNGLSAPEVTALAASLGIYGTVTEGGVSSDERALRQVLLNPENYVPPTKEESQKIIDGWSDQQVREVAESQGIPTQHKLLDAPDDMLDEQAKEAKKSYQKDYDFYKQRVEELKLKQANGEDLTSNEKQQLDSFQKKMEQIEQFSVPVPTEQLRGKIALTPPIEPFEDKTATPSTQELKINDLPAAELLEQRARDAGRQLTPEEQQFVDSARQRAQNLQDEANNNASPDELRRQHEHYLEAARKIEEKAAQENRDLNSVELAQIDSAKRQAEECREKLTDHVPPDTHKAIETGVTTNLDSMEYERELRATTVSNDQKLDQLSDHSAGVLVTYATERLEQEYQYYVGEGDQANADRALERLEKINPKARIELESEELKRQRDLFLQQSNVEFEEAKLVAQASEKLEQDYAYHLAKGETAEAQAIETKLYSLNRDTSIAIQVLSEPGHEKPTENLDAASQQKLEIFKQQAATVRDNADVEARQDSEKQLDQARALDDRIQQLNAQANSTTLGPDLSDHVTAALQAQDQTGQPLFNPKEVEQYLDVTHKFGNLGDKEVKHIAEDYVWELQQQKDLASKLGQVEEAKEIQLKIDHIQESVRQAEADAYLQRMERKKQEFEQKRDELNGQGKTKEANYYDKQAEDQQKKIDQFEDSARRKDQERQDLHEVVLENVPLEQVKVYVDEHEKRNQNSEYGGFSSDVFTLNALAKEGDETAKTVLDVLNLDPKTLSPEHKDIIYIAEQLLEQSGLAATMPAVADKLDSMKDEIPEEQEETDEKPEKKKKKKKS